MDNFKFMFNFEKLQNNFYAYRQNIGEIMRYLFGFFYFRLYLIILLGVNLINWLLAWWLEISVNQDLMILHYNINFGVNLIGEVNRVFIIPALGLIIILINTVLASVNMRHKDFKFITIILQSVALVVNFFLLLALGSVYLINFR